MADPLHLKPEPEPEYEQVRLGDRTYEMDAATAQGVRDAFESLAAQYGAALEQYRAQAMQSIGTPQPQFQQHLPPPMPEMVGVPNPDLLFQNKDAWSDEFGRSIEGRFAQQGQTTTAQMQGLAKAFQDELNRRDQAQAAKQNHDQKMAEMLERYGLTENTRVVQAVYDELFPKLQHMPLELALDRIGAESREEIRRIQSGERWELGNSPQTQTGVAPRPPAMLRSARRASRAAPAPTPPSDPGLQAPNGELGMMGQIIRKRQQQIMSGGRSA